MLVVNQRLLLCDKGTNTTSWNPPYQTLLASILLQKVGHQYSWIPPLLWGFPFTVQRDTRTGEGLEVECSATDTLVLDCMQFITRTTTAGRSRLSTPTRGWIWSKKFVSREVINIYLFWHLVQNQRALERREGGGEQGLPTFFDNIQLGWCVNFLDLDPSAGSSKNISWAQNEAALFPNQYFSYWASEILRFDPWPLQHRCKLAWLNECLEVSAASNSAQKTYVKMIVQAVLNETQLGGYTCGR